MNPSSEWSATREWCRRRTATANAAIHATEHDHACPDRTVRIEPLLQETFLPHEQTEMSAHDVEMTKHQPDAGAISDGLLVRGPEVIEQARDVARIPPDLVEERCQPEHARTPRS